MPNVRPNTLASIDVAIRVHMKPHLPDMPLNLIKGIDLQRFFMSLMQSRTRKIIFDVLNASLKDAQNLKNPMQGVKIPAHKRERGTPLET